jgi:hypothetical protein
MRASILYLLIPILVSVLGCASSNTSVNVDNHLSSDITIRKLLVLALTPIDENRETGEKELVYWLKRGNYDATASFDILTVRGRLPVIEEVKRVLENNDFDGVLALRLVDFDESSRFVSSSEKNATNLNETYFYNYLNAWNGNYQPGYYSNSRLMVVESNLYAFPTGEIVYSTISESFISDSFEGFAEDFAKATTKSLKRTKVLVKIEE